MTTKQSESTQAYHKTLRNARAILDRISERLELLASDVDGIKLWEHVGSMTHIENELGLLADTMKIDTGAKQ